MPRKLTALRYTYVDGMLEKRAPHRGAHLAHVAEWESRGLLLAGALGDPPSGAFFAFEASTEDVEAFTAADPYVLAGLITAQAIEPYAVVSGLSAG